MMGKLPKQYAWLSNEGAPKMLVEALKLYGIQETPGKSNNPIILDWAKETGLANVYKHDETAWCGLAMAVIAKRAGYEPVKEPLWALNWAKFGQPAPVPMLGDVLVFKRFDGAGKLIGGHVTLYVGEDLSGYFHGLGGNQSDSFNIQRIAKNRLFAARRADFKIGQPANVRKIILSPTGTISINEA